MLQDSNNTSGIKKLQRKPPEMVSSQLMETTMQHAVPANTTGLPEERLQVAIDVFYELDDIIGRLDSAIKVMDMLTEDMPQNRAIVPLFDRHKELQSIIEKTWPVVVKGEPLPQDDLFRKGARVQIDGKSYELVRYHLDIDAWDLYRNGKLDFTLSREALRARIQGIQFC